MIILKPDSCPVLCHIIDVQYFQPAVLRCLSGNARPALSCRRYLKCLSAYLLRFEDKRHFRLIVSFPLSSVAAIYMFAVYIYLICIIHGPFLITPIICIATFISTIITYLCYNVYIKRLRRKNMKQDITTIPISEVLEQTDGCFVCRMRKCWKSARWNMHPARR